jgi:hypothetical protein
MDDVPAASHHILVPVRDPARRKPQDRRKDRTMSVTLTRYEVREITGYKRGAEQLAELHRQGYWRARRSPMTGAVIVERAHYDAVRSMSSHRDSAQSVTRSAARSKIVAHPIDA